MKSAIEAICQDRHGLVSAQGRKIFVALHSAYRDEGSRSAHDAVLFRIGRHGCLQSAHSLYASASQWRYESFGGGATESKQAVAIHRRKGIGARGKEQDARHHHAGCRHHSLRMHRARGMANWVALIGPDSLSYPQYMY